MTFISNSELEELLPAIYKWLLPVSEPTWHPVLKTSTHQEGKLFYLSSSSHELDRASLDNHKLSINETIELSEHQTLSRSEELKMRFYNLQNLGLESIRLSYVCDGENNEGMVWPVIETSDKKSEGDNLVLSPVVFDNWLWADPLELDFNVKCTDSEENGHIILKADITTLDYESYANRAFVGG